MGNWTLPPGASIPLQRHAAWDQVWIVHKGQGRATVEQEHTTVLPGSVISVPRQMWYRLRNTGTGLLQGVWVASPAGLERSFRELAQRSGAEPGAFQQVAQQVGIELRFEPEAAVEPVHPARGHRRPRRGRRGRTSPSIPSQPQPATSQSSQTAATPTAPPAGPPPPSGKRRRRRRGGRRGAGVQPAAAKPASAAPVAHAPPKLAPSGSPSGSGPSPRRDRSRRRFGRVKEVYMGGRWVRVEGSGPVISTGEGSRDSDKP